MNINLSKLNIKLISAPLEEPKPHQKRIHKYTYDMILDKTKEIYGDIFDLSETKPEDIVGYTSSLHVRCKICAYTWKATIETFIKDKRGCGKCQGRRLKWNLDIFIERASKIHGEKYDYSEVTDTQILEKGRLS